MAQTGEKSEKSEERSETPRLAWDTEAAAHELDKALAVIDTALSAPWLTASQRNVVGVFKVQVQEYHARRDVLLFGAAPWIGGHIGRWRAEHDARIRGRVETAREPS